MLAVFGPSLAPALLCCSLQAGHSTYLPRRCWQCLALLRLLLSRVVLHSVVCQVIMLVFMHHVPVFTRVCVTHLGFGLVPGYLALLVLGRLA